MKLLHVTVVVISKCNRTPLLRALQRHDSVFQKGEWLSDGMIIYLLGVGSSVDRQTHTPNVPVDNPPVKTNERVRSFHIKLNKV